MGMPVEHLVSPGENLRKRKRKKERKKQEREEKWENLACKTEFGTSHPDFRLHCV